MKARLQVMKFGGTSVGDAACIARTAQIIAKAAKGSGCIAVVSAMSGVTNRLIEAAKKAQAGNTAEAAAVVDALRKQHEAALTTLIHHENERARIRQRLEDVLAEGRRLCEGTTLLRELTPRTLDSISSLGERLSAPLVAAALEALGTRSESIDATELIVTDPYHGGAEPLMDQTRERSEAGCVRSCSRELCQWSPDLSAHRLKAHLRRSAEEVPIIPQPSWAPPSTRMKSSFGRTWMACSRPTLVRSRRRAPFRKFPIAKPLSSPISALKSCIRKRFGLSCLP